MADEHLDISEDDLSDSETRKMIMDKRRKKTSGGGFQTMGFSYKIMKAILRKGYKVPTPIQRKTIPAILQGRDVVAMARTGSGKTAAFLLPMFEKLKIHSAKTGARALILSPTRELAVQTYKFSREFSRFTDLTATMILGGDSMGKQFEAMHSNPDIIIATPGRLLHVLVEMSLKLTEVEYVVFDEADRLFEMGFAEQLKEILNRLPDHRQTLLFSATLPQQLVDFAKAGLHDPQLIRLDLEQKLPELLRTDYIYCRQENKDAIAVHLLKNAIDERQMTLVFAATRHHVEYLKELLTKADISCAYVYSSMDQEARKMSIERFRSRRTTVLLVTDVAARGIDIPLLDNVINYNFPAKPKLFIHRVGRAARAGRPGKAFSLVTSDELPYFEALQMFLDRPIKLATSSMSNDEDSVIGCALQSVVDEESDWILKWIADVPEVTAMKQVCLNAYKQYLRSRPAPSAASVRKAKALNMDTVGVHPIFYSKQSDSNQAAKEASDERLNILNSLKNYKSRATIFEINANRKETQAHAVMQSKRKFHEKVIAKKSQTKETEQKIASVEKEMAGSYKDSSFYIDYQNINAASESGLQLEKSAINELNEAVFDVIGDDDAQMRKLNSTKKWDRKKKKFMGESNDDPKKKKIRTESGAWIPASYKSDLYKKWKNNQRIDAQSDDDEMDEDMKEARQMQARQRPSMPKVKGNGRAPKRELKTHEEIFKVRQKEEFKKKCRERAQAKKKGLPVGGKGSKKEQKGKGSKKPPNKHTIRKNQARSGFKQQTAGKRR